jgi:hypothetical protein
MNSEDTKDTDEGSYIFGPCVSSFVSFVSLVAMFFGSER